MIYNILFAVSLIALWAETGYAVLFSTYVNPQTMWLLLVSNLIAWGIVYLDDGR